MSRPCDYGKCDPERCTDPACLEDSTPLESVVFVTVDRSKPGYSTLGLQHNGSSWHFNKGGNDAVEM